MIVCKQVEHGRWHWLKSVEGKQVKEYLEGTINGLKNGCFHCSVIIVDSFRVLSKSWVIQETWGKYKGLYESWKSPCKSLT